MNPESKKCARCRYELENNLPIAYNDFRNDFEILDEHGDSLTVNGTAACRTCGFPVRFMQECLINEKLYLEAAAGPHTPSS